PPSQIVRGGRGVELAQAHAGGSEARSVCATEEGPPQDRQEHRRRGALRFLVEARDRDRVPEAAAGLPGLSERPEPLRDAPVVESIGRFAAIAPPRAPADVARDAQQGEAVLELEAGEAQKT